MTEKEKFRPENPDTPQEMSLEETSAELQNMELYIEGMKEWLQDDQAELERLEKTDKILPETRERVEALKSEISELEVQIAELSEVIEETREEGGTMHIRA